MIIDLFAGPGGWDVGLWLLGGPELVADCLGIEWDASACDTRRAAGLRTWQADVSVVQPTSLCTPGQLAGLIASPPCKALSKAGKREAIEHLPALARAIAAEQWDARPSDDPLVWLVLEVGRWCSQLRPPNACVRDEDEPAPTIAFGHAGPEWVLNTGRDWKPGGTREDAQTLPIDGPAPSVTGKSGEQWQFTRPATTIAGDERLWPPGHKENSNPPGKYQQRRGERADKLNPAQALVLQSFPSNYPVRGSKTKKFEQIGNAVPPLLAAHALAVTTGRTAPQ